MAGIKINCPECGEHIECDEGYRGSQINCPTCNGLFLVPQAMKTASTLPESLPTPAEPTLKLRRRQRPDYVAEAKEWEAVEEEPQRQVKYVKQINRNAEKQSTLPSLFLALGIILLIFVGLLLYGRSKWTIEGLIDRPVIRSNGTASAKGTPGSLAWRVSVIASSLHTSPVPLDKGEVLLVEEDRLRNLVLEYNQEITEKSRGFQNRWDAAVKETIQNPGIPPAELGVAEEWREAKRNLLLDKIYGQKQKETNAPSLGLIGLSGESSESTKSGKGKSETSGTPFFFTGIDTEERFRLTLPRRGVWCFFIVASTPNEQCYWFKRERFFLGKTVEIGAGDRVHSYNRDDGGLVNVFFNTKDEFIVRVLKQKYGLLDPSLSRTHD
jgi:hypothetical protein